MRMKEERVPKKTLKVYVEGRRPIGSAQMEMVRCRGQDAKRMLKCSNWKRPAEGRDA
jgi:hypothetical protein